MASWPAFPDVYQLAECPEGAVCVAYGDHVAIVGWINQVERIHDTLSACPGVEFKELPDPTHVSP